MKHASSNHNEYVDLSLGTRYSDVYLLCKYLIEVSIVTCQSTIH